MASTAALQVPNFKGMSIVEVLTRARELGLKVEATGSGVAAQQSPKPGPATGKVVLRVKFMPPS